MLWTLQLEFLNSEQCLIGLHFSTNFDTLNQVNVFTSSLGLAFLTVRLSLARRKKGL